MALFVEPCGLWSEFRVRSALTGLEDFQLLQLSLGRQQYFSFLVSDGDDDHMYLMKLRELSEDL